MSDKRAETTLFQSQINLLLHALHGSIAAQAAHALQCLTDNEGFDFLAYPPSAGLTPEELAVLQASVSNPILASALQKLLANSAAAVAFDLLSTIDGTTAPEGEGWQGVRLVDRCAAAGPAGTEFLHDQFFDSYWNWRAQQPDAEPQ